MKILITGASGMLGRSLCLRFAKKYDLLGLDIVELKACSLKLKGFIEGDITEKGKVNSQIVSEEPDVVIHAAAYTDVDGCELNPEKAEEVNARGTQNVAQACKDCGCLMVYISTDYVFDGKKQGPYSETDVPVPLNVYGRTKLDGENYIKEMLKRFLIIRSSWLFGKGGKNFVDTIIKAAFRQDTIEVVNDQFGSPTYTEHLVEAIEKLLLLIDKTPFDTYHVTNSGSCSRFDCACRIKELKKLKNKIEPISSAEVKRPAKRSLNSRLDNRRFINLTDFSLPHWETALKLYLNQID